MIKRNVAVLSGLVAAFVGVARLAGADDLVPSLDLRNFEPPTDPQGGLSYEPATSPATGDANAVLWLSFAHRPISLIDSKTGETRFSVIGRQVTGDFVANVGLFEKFAVGVDVPFLLFQDGDDPHEPAHAAALATLGDYALPAHALGDVRVVVKATMLPPTSGEFGGFSMAMVERLSLPTGARGSFLGEGAVASDTRILAEYGLVAVALHAQLGVKLRAEHEDFACAAMLRPGPDGPILEIVPVCPTRFGGELPFGLAASVKPRAFGFDPDGHVILFAETFGHLPLSPHGPFSDARLAAVQLGGGARYSFDNDLSVLVGVDAALVGGIGTAPVHAAMSLGWSPRKHDLDDDGVLDKADVCHDLAEDHDGFEDKDGCPEWDNDGDDVPDGEDRCATAVEDHDGFEDKDGCPDPDNDGDGIADVADHCPEVPGVASEIPTLRGCPDPDPDKDGVLGAADRCADVPEDLDGFEDADGCPEPDNDGDGFADAGDACPDTVGVRSEHADEQGCPDTDGDGIADGKDACLAETGVRAEDPTKNGCPAEEKKPKKGRKSKAAKAKKDALPPVR